MDWGGKYVKYFRGGKEIVGCSFSCYGGGIKKQRVFWALCFSIIMY